MYRLYSKLILRHKQLSLSGYNIVLWYIKLYVIQEIPTNGLTIHILMLLLSYIIQSLTWTLSKISYNKTFFVNSYFRFLTFSEANFDFYNKYFIFKHLHSKVHIWWHVKFVHNLIKPVIWLYFHLVRTSRTRTRGGCPRVLQF